MSDRSKEAQEALDKANKAKEDPDNIHNFRRSQDPEAVSGRKPVGEDVADYSSNHLTNSYGEAQSEALAFVGLPTGDKILAAYEEAERKERLKREQSKLGYRFKKLVRGLFKRNKP